MTSCGFLRAQIKSGVRALDIFPSVSASKLDINVHYILFTGVPWNSYLLGDKPHTHLEGSRNFRTFMGAWEKKGFIGSFYTHGEFTGRSVLFFAGGFHYFNNLQFFAFKIFTGRFSYTILLHIKRVPIYFG